MVFSAPFSVLALLTKEKRVILCTCESRSKHDMGSQMKWKSYSREHKLSVVEFWRLHKKNHHDFVIHFSALILSFTASLPHPLTPSPLTPSPCHPFFISKGDWCTQPLHTSDHTSRLCEWMKPAIRNLLVYFFMKSTRQTLS